MAYAGALGRIKPEIADSLEPSRYAFQAKSDGVYVDVTTDDRGLIAELRYRSGAPVGADAGDLVGLEVGLPSALLHGELNAQTEAGLRDRVTHGARVHLFDVSRAAGSLVAWKPYLERSAVLHRWQAAVECEEDGWTLDVDGRARSVSTGLYVRPARRNLKRLPVLPMYRGKGAFDRVWADVERWGWEGAVAVDLTAPLGAKGAKQKIKAHTSLDCVVVEVGRRAVRLAWKGYSFSVSAVGWAPKLSKGLVVELRCDGFYERQVIPKFPRIVRIRHDLTRPVPAPQ